LICVLRARSSCGGYFKKLELLTVPCLFVYGFCMFKFNNPGLFETNSGFHTYNTRNKSNIVIPVRTTNSLNKNPYYLAVTLFDHLSKLMSKIKNINLFRNLLKKLLLEKEYCDVKLYLQDKFTDSDVLKF
jgi:hypothetical protein